MYELIKKAQGLNSYSGFDAMGEAAKILKSGSLTPLQQKILLHGLGPVKLDSECENNIAGGMSGMYDSCILSNAIKYSLDPLYHLDVGLKYLELNNPLAFSDHFGGFEKLMSSVNGDIYYASKAKVFFTCELERYNFEKSTKFDFEGGYSSLIFLDFKQGLRFMLNFIAGKYDFVDYVKNINLIDNGLSSINYSVLVNMLGYKLFVKLTE